ncbi:hypothetical protein F5146DRAFT_1135440 [Armillaria mellea]|nr:hypothetical protein F5146DRAFT_1135440 [Armillaria mellea]
MRFSLVVLPLSALVGSSAASLNARQLPSCAVSCITGSNTSYGDCSASDNACLCKNANFVSSAESCITSNCTGDDLQTALSAAQALCAAAGVTLTSEAVSATSTSPSSSSSASSASRASSSASTSASAASTSSSNGALTVGSNAVAGLAAIGLVALAL